MRSQELCRPTAQGRREEGYPNIKGDSTYGDYDRYDKVEKRFNEDRSRLQSQYGGIAQVKIIHNAKADGRRGGYQEQFNPVVEERKYGGRQMEVDRSEGNFRRGQ